MSKKEEKYRDIIENEYSEYLFIKYIKSGTAIDGEMVKKPSLLLKCQYCKNILLIRVDSFLIRKHRCTKCCGSYEKSFAYHIEQELKQDINNVWDFEKNTVNPYYISRSSKNKVFIKCQEKDYHESYKIWCSSFIYGNRCSYCNVRGKQIHPKDSFAQYHIDNTDPKFLEKYWDRKRNNEFNINPWEISPQSNKIKVWIKCQSNDTNSINNIEKSKYHKSYLVSCNGFTTGSRCPYCVCRPLAVKTYDSFGYHNPILAQMWSPKNTISPYKVSNSSNNKYLFICDECGDEIKKSLDLISFKGFSCPTCNQSSGEKNIRNWLELNNIKYIYDQSYFQELIGLGGGILRPDFILPDYKIWIEYDGEFHYGKGVSQFYQTDEQLSIQQQHDKLKDEYAKKHGWKMIRIPYWEKDDIKDILDTQLGEMIK